jgi:hypothetical protein
MTSPILEAFDARVVDGQIVGKKMSKSFVERFHDGATAEAAQCGFQEAYLAVGLSEEIPKFELVQN